LAVLLFWAVAHSHAVPKIFEKQTVFFVGVLLCLLIMSFFNRIGFIQKSIKLVIVFTAVVFCTVFLIGEDLRMSMVVIQEDGWRYNCVFYDNSTLTIERDANMLAGSSFQKGSYEVKNGVVVVEDKLVDKKGFFVTKRYAVGQDNSKERFYLVPLDGYGEIIEDEKGLLVTELIDTIPPIVFYDNK